MSSSDKSPPGTGMARWTREEDETLATSVRACLPWTEISVLVSRLNPASQKSPKQCCQRWQRVLNPAIRKGHWTKEEERILQAAVARLGTRAWAEVSKEISGRTGLQCRTRWIQSQQRQRIQQQASVEHRIPTTPTHSMDYSAGLPHAIRTHTVTHTITSHSHPLCVPVNDAHIAGNGRVNETRMEPSADVGASSNSNSADMWSHLMRASRQMLDAPSGVSVVGSASNSTLALMSSNVPRYPSSDEATLSPPLESKQMHKLSFSWILN